MDIFRVLDYATSTLSAQCEYLRSLRIFLAQNYEITTFCIQKKMQKKFK